MSTFRWDHRLQYKTSSWHLDGFPNGSNIGVNSVMSGRNPPLCCTLPLIAMQEHEEYLEAVHLTSYMGTIPTWLASDILA